MFCNYSTLVNTHPCSVMNPLIGGITRCGHIENEGILHIKSPQWVSLFCRMITEWNPESQSVAMRSLLDAITSPSHNGKGLLSPIMRQHPASLLWRGSQCKNDHCVHCFVRQSTVFIHALGPRVNVEWLWLLMAKCARFKSHLDTNNSPKLLLLNEQLSN